MITVTDKIGEGVYFFLGIMGAKCFHLMAFKNVTWEKGLYIKL